MCKNFAGAVDAISFTNKEHPVVLFLGGYPQGLASRFRRALKLRESYIWMQRSPIVPLVAVLWPKAKAEEFLAWTEEHPRSVTRADDGVAGRWQRDTKQQIRISVPSLVEHPDTEPSVKGGQRARWGKDPMRRALHVADDGLTYNW